MVKVNDKECPTLAKGRALYGIVYTCIKCIKTYDDVKPRAQRLYGPKQSSRRKRKAAAPPQNDPPPPPKSKRLQNIRDEKKKIEEDKKQEDEDDDELNYFSNLDLFPEGMEIGERTKTKNENTSKQYYCRKKNLYKT